MRLEQGQDAFEDWRSQWTGVFFFFQFDKFL
jgi:hypothetical protein